MQVRFHFFFNRLLECFANTAWFSFSNFGLGKILLKTFASN